MKREQAKQLVRAALKAVAGTGDWNANFIMKEFKVDESMLKQVVRQAVKEYTHDTYTERGRLADQEFALLANWFKNKYRSKLTELLPEGVSLTDKEADSLYDYILDIVENEVSYLDARWYNKYEPL
jgi:hypothetical protein